MDIRGISISPLYTTTILTAHPVTWKRTLQIRFLTVPTDRIAKERLKKQYTDTGEWGIETGTGFSVDTFAKVTSLLRYTDYT